MLKIDPERDNPILRNNLRIACYPRGCNHNSIESSTRDFCN